LIDWAVQIRTMAPTSSRTRLFVIEQDPLQRQQLVHYLVGQGFDAQGAPSPLHASALQSDLYPDVVILGRTTPEMNGIDACKRMREQHNHLPFIRISDSSDELERILSLEMGADDCLSHPFSPRELVARVRAVLRRMAQAVHAATTVEAGAIRMGEQQFQPEARGLKSARGFRALNPVEFALLDALVHSASTPLSRPQLMDAMRRCPGEITPRAVDAAIMRLRKLVEPNPNVPRYIQTVRGQGYVFVPHDSKTPAVLHF